MAWRGRLPRRFRAAGHHAGHGRPSRQPRVRRARSRRLLPGGRLGTVRPGHRVHRREGTRAALRPHERPHQRPGHRRRGRLRRLPAGAAGGARDRRRNHRVLHGRPHVAGSGGRHRGQDRRGRVVPRGAGRHPRRPEQPAPGGRQDPRRGLRGRLHRRPGVHRRARRTARQRADLGRRAAHHRVLPRAPRVRRSRQRALRPCAGRAALGGAARFLRRAALIRWTRDYAGAGVIGSAAIAAARTTAARWPRNGTWRGCGRRSGSGRTGRSRA